MGPDYESWIASILDDTTVTGVPGPSRWRFTMTLECAERWGLYNESDASIFLEDLVKAEQPELAARLGFDPEADLMYVYAHAREDLEAVARLAANASGPSDPDAWTNKLFEDHYD